MIFLSARIVQSSYSFGFVQMGDIISLPPKYIRQMFDSKKYNLRTAVTSRIMKRGADASLFRDSPSHLLLAGNQYDDTTGGDGNRTRIAVSSPPSSGVFCARSACKCVGRQEVVSNARKAGGGNSGGVYRKPYYSYVQPST